MVKVNATVQKVRLIQGLYKPIQGNCAIYFYPGVSLIRGWWSTFYLLFLFILSFLFFNQHPRNSLTTSGRLLFVQGVFFCHGIHNHFSPPLGDYVFYFFGKSPFWTITCGIFFGFCLVSPLVFTTFFGEYVFFCQSTVSPRKLQRTGKTWWNLAEAGRRNHYLSPATRDVWHDHWKIERRIPGSEWNHGNAA